MLSLRTLTRSIPRSIFRSSTTSLRRPLSTVRKPSALQSQLSWRQASFRLAVPAFSTSQARREMAGEFDQELAAKIEQELQLEKDTMEEDKKDLQKSIDDFLESSQFTLVDKPGHEDVQLTRKFGNEDIKITFSIADVNALQDEAEDEADAALLDEEDDDITPQTQSGGALSKNTVNQGRTKGGNISIAPEDSVSKADQEDMPVDGEDAMDQTSGEVSFPVRLYVTITKPDGGALHIQTLAEDGFIQIEDVHYFEDASLADAQNAEKDWKRRGLYSGPPFENLDTDLQMLLERYLEERGINSALATFVPDYAELKEQKEYLGWLGNVKKFVEA